MDRASASVQAAWEKYAEGDEKGFYDKLQAKNVENFTNVSLM